ncbi:MAG: hypothetical protein U5L96_04975 [Owenweeksia sp.]|nr:hypothetical protein [Owenweeksia sp.]
MQTNQDTDWDIAFFAQSSFSAIPIRINDVNGAELYVYPKADISHWNSVGLAERKVQVLSVYPNPANDELHLALNAEFGTEVSVALINTSGKVAKNKTLQLKGGMENLPYISARCIARCIRAVGEWR